MENAKKFFEEIIKTEEAKALIDSTEAPATEEACIAAYIEIAKKLGVELTAEDIKEYYVSSRMSYAQEIDDKELEQLVGGGENAACGYSYIKDENCIFADACNHLWQDYSPTVEKIAENGSDAIWDHINLEYYSQCYHLSVRKKYNEKILAISKK